MKLLNKIRAFFTFNGEKQQMELSGAEVKRNGVFLHPADDPTHTFFIKSNSVDILINQDGEVSEDDISVIDKEVAKVKDKKEKTQTDTKPRPLISTRFIPEKKRFSVLLYADEYDMLMKNITENGYKRTEYFLACMTSAKKQNFDSVYKKYTSEHKKRRQLEKEEPSTSQEQKI